MTVEKLLQIAVDSCDNKKASDIVVFDLEKSDFLYDYSVICHATTNRQVEAIAEEVRENVKENNYKIYNVEGLKESNWVLIDLGDVIVNVMTTKDRDYYKLDKFFEKYPVKEV